MTKELYYLIWVYDYKGDRKEKYQDWLASKSGRNLLNKIEPKSKFENLKKLISNLLTDNNYFDYRLDYLCLFIKELGLLEKSEVPNRSLYSYSKLRQYDPAKNAKNILKHGISFRDVTDDSNCFFGDLVTHTHSKGEDRSIYFSRVSLNNEFKYIMSICQFPDSEFDLEIGKLTDQMIEKNEINYINERGITPDDISKLIAKLPPDTLGKIMNSVPSMRIISSRYFNDNNYEEVIKQAIKDENLDETVLNSLRELAIKTIKRINQF